MKHLQLPLNTKGKDFIIGDLHGCIKKFWDKMYEIKFNPTIDRMFSVGDLNDRGTASVSCLNLIKEPWFYSVLGNHEQMMMDAYNQQGEYWTRYDLELNGGKWFYDIPPEKQLEMVNLVKDLPVSISIGNKIGICHAEPPSSDWNNAKNPNSNHVLNMLWARTWLQKSKPHVFNIQHTYHGHTPVKKPITTGNSTFLDTGAVFKDGELTCLKLKY